MTATEDDDDHGFNSKLEYDTTACLTHENHTVEVAMASAPDADVTDDDPKSLPEAMSRSDWPEWKKVMDEELALMMKYEVWNEVDQPEETDILGLGFPDQT